MSNKLLPYGRLLGRAAALPPALGRRRLLSVCEALKPCMNVLRTIDLARSINLEPRRQSLLHQGLHSLFSLHMDVSWTWPDGPAREMQNTLHGRTLASVFAEGTVRVENPLGVRLPL